MRALFITNKFLGDGEQPVTGTYRRLGFLLEAVAGISASLELAVLVPHDLPVTPQTVAHYAALYGEWVRCPFTLRLIPRLAHTGRLSLKGYLTRPWDLYSPGYHRYHMTSGPAQIAALREAFAAGPDLVFVQRLNALAPVLRGGLRHPAMFFDLDDIEHRAHLRSIFAPPHWGTKFLGLLHTPPLLLAQRRAIALARRTYVCSPQDRDDLRRLYRTDRVESIANSVRFPPPTPLPAAPTLLFLGSMIFAPNLAAADWLTGKVWPRVHAAMPSARLIVAGEFPERAAAFRAPPPGVEFRGFVENLDDLYREMRVVASPILSGSGTRNKIVEAAAYGRPVVSTTLGTEGLAFADGRDILLRDRPAAFAAACLRLLREDALCATLAANARRIAERDYERGQVMQQLQASLLAALPAR